ncbi:MAG: VaFE repeat-containing surface-anchored protein [Bacillota bacterium]
MRDKRRIREKLLAVFLMVSVTVTMIPAGFLLSTDQVRAATTYAYSVTRPTTTVNGHKTHVAIFSVSSMGLKGACCQMGRWASKGKTSVKRMSGTDTRVKLMYYYGYQKGHLGKVNKNGLLLGRSLSWLSGHDQTYPLTKAEVKNYINAMPSSLTVPDRFECYICNPTSGAQDFIACRMKAPGYVTLYKTSTDACSMASGSGYSFEGIEYTVYDSKGTEAGKLTCKANGTTNTLTLDTGTYTVKETKTNQWYELNTCVYTQNLTSGQTWAISAEDSPEEGTIHIKKRVSGRYDGNLAFEFKLTNTANTAISYRAKTDTGTGEADVKVVQGTYRCEEILPEDSELMDMTGPQTGTVGIGETCTFERENAAPSEGMLQVRKTTNDGGSAAGFSFKVTGELYNQGKLTEDDVLKAADISVGGYDEEIFEAGEWKVSKEDLDELNRAAADRETGKKTLRLRGVLKHKNGAGVALEGAEVALGSEEADTTSGEEADEDASDAELSAEISVNLKPVEYVYNSEDPESSAYETDTEKQIKNAKSGTEESGGCSVTCSGFDWYGAATAYQEIRDGKLTGNTQTVLETEKTGTTPALTEGITFGRFTVEEVMSEDQKKQYRQPEAQTKEITREDGKAAFIFSFENEARWTGTELVKTSSDGNVSGITFRLEGKNSRGENVEGEAVTDSDGKIDFGKLYAGEYVISEKDFDPDKYENNNRLEGYDVPAQKLTITGDEEEAVTVQFDNVPLKSLYLTKVDRETRLFLNNAVFSLLEGDDQLAMFRITLDDYDRACIDMISCDEKSGIRAGTAQVPDDEYNYAVIKGLKEGRTYTLKEVTAPTGYAATALCTFTFEDGQKLVLENAAPAISTSAADRATKNHMSDAEGTVTISDTVSYSNLEPGHRYIMSGVLALKPCGERTEEQQAQDVEGVEIVKDAKGKEVTARKEFIPDSESGTVEIRFTFDASLLDGRQVVAMEQLTDPELDGINGTETVLASHEDINDEAQSIYFPELGTKAAAGDTGKHITNADGEVEITDTVAYSNVIAGKVYVLTGTLMDKDTGKPLLSGGKKITSSVTFRAEKDGPVFAAEGGELAERPGDGVELVSGEVEMKFTFDGSALAGKKAVVFEKLTTGGKLVGEHSDMNDTEQTVYLPAIETVASTNGTDRISDKVTYRNLIPGESYLMDGVLMDKGTGEEFLFDGAAVTAQTEFVPGKEKGTMVMEFPVGVKDLEGKTLVAFETCSILMEAGDSTGEKTAVEVASHRDIDSKAQTVSFKVPQTGQSGPWKILIPSGLFTAALISLLLRRLRRA